MNWLKELEARLADDPRLERRKSRYAAGEGFYFRNREVAYFPDDVSFRIRMSAAVVFALGALTTHDAVKEVSKDGVLLGVTSEESLDFARGLLDRIFREKPGERRPEGKNTRAGGWSAKRKATKSFEDARALRALRELKPTDEEEC